MKKNLINSLQVFRGLAALAVVCHHATLSTAAFIGNIPSIFESFLNMGYLGVDFFFVLSGFIIMYTHFNDKHSLISVKRYILKRLFRIFPTYLPISLTIIIAYYYIPTLSASGGRQFSIISSLLLIPNNLPPALSVAWTLIHELLFYFVFLLFFLSRKLFVIGLLLRAMSISLFNYLNLVDGWLKYLFSFLNLEFILGVLSAWYIKSKQKFLHPYLYISFGLIISLLSLTCIFYYKIPTLRLLLAIGLALIVTGYAIIEIKKPIIWFSGFLLLGNASYSIYLVHNPLLSITQRLLLKINLDWSISLIIGIFLSIMLGIIYYYLIERPAIFFSKKILYSTKSIL